MSKRLVLLVGHSNPPIHGQSIQAAQLVSGSSDWQDIQIDALNTVYSETREGLSGASIWKVCKMVVYAFRLCVRAIHNKPDAIIISPAFHLGAFLKDSLFILIAKKICRAEVIAWIHMDPHRLQIDQQPKWFQIYCDYVVKQLDCLVGCAPSLAEKWPGFLNGIPVVSIPNGVVDDGHLVYDSGQSNEKLVIGYLSALDHQKGWRDFYGASQNLCEIYPNVEFHLYGGVGADETLEGIEQVFASNPHSSCIVWHGATWGVEKNSAFQKMDLYCFPSHTEAFPLAVLEAMSFSLPIVFTDVGAVKDAVIESQGGWICDANNTPSLQATLNEAISQQARWNSMGEYNRQRYLDHFSVDAFINCWHEELRKFLANSSCH